MVVRNGIQALIGHFDIAGTFLGKNGITLHDKGVAQLIAYIVPQTRRRVAKQVTIAVVFNGIGYTQLVVHQRRYEVKVRGAMLEDG